MGDIGIERSQAGIVTVWLDRPESLNALTVGMMRELRATLASLGQDGDCRVIVLAGRGRSFCAGLDLKAVAAADTGPGAIGRMALQEIFAAAIPQIRRLPQPVVAAVQGAAAGAGFALSLASDIRIAAPSAKFLIGAVRIGLTAGECGISYHLPRVIGAGRAFEIMLTGRPVGADEALSCGLVTQLAPEAELHRAALMVAQRIIENSPYSVKHTKQLMWANLDAGSLEQAMTLENHAQTVAMLTEDFAEATQAFGEKRPPRFTGR